MSRMLIVYYSVSNGNTRRIAEQMQRATGADIAEIRTVQPYTGSYQDIVDQGQREVERGYKPEIRPLAVDLADYDVIAVGTPTWWYTMAPAVKTFLESHDWAGKTVIPFCTSSSSGLGESGDLLEELAGTGAWLEGQRFRSSVSEADVADWVNGLAL